MNIAAYCRVSTEKEDQLNSLEAQKQFFSEYTQRTGDTLIRLYADEGLSGTKIKNRKEFLRMMADAEHHLFDMVVVKDISRFARNTVDLLQNVRKLKALGIETQFLTANMTSMGNSEFVLTIFGALAQEESANTSKRVKFGKKLNAEKGRVPNIVYGYDKTIGDYFNLTINEKEASGGLRFRQNRQYAKRTGPKNQTQLPMEPERRGTYPPKRTVYRKNHQWQAGSHRLPDRPENGQG